MFQRQCDHNMCPVRIFIHMISSTEDIVLSPFQEKYSTRVAESAGSAYGVSSYVPRDVKLS
jgi:hypothetical protein